MEEKYLQTVLEILAREIEQLRITVDCLRYEKRKLEEELELFKAPREHTEVKKYETL